VPNDSKNRPNGIDKPSGIAIPDWGTNGMNEDL